MKKYVIVNKGTDDAQLLFNLIEGEDIGFAGARHPVTIYNRLEEAETALKTQYSSPSLVDICELTLILKKV